MNIERLEINFKGLRFLVHEEAPGYWAECPAYPGLVTQGEDMKQLRMMIREATDLYFDGEESPCCKGSLISKLNCFICSKCRKIVDLNKGINA